MHPTAKANAKRFFDVYVQRGARILEIGSLDTNGSLREVAPAGCSYTGVDLCAGKGVDVIMTDPYVLPFLDDGFDVVLSSSCFEHSQMFWLLFNDALRVLKPTGLFYVNAPSNGWFHRRPVDCWRFYPDAADALVAWARRCGGAAAVLESYTSRQRDDLWNDFVAVFLKDAGCVGRFPARIVDQFSDFENGKVFGSDVWMNMQPEPEDVRRWRSPGKSLKEKAVNGGPWWLARPRLGKFHFWKKRSVER